MIYKQETVTAVLELLREFDSNIGLYMGHVDPGYNTGINLVLLSNGKIQVPVEILSDFQDHPERITPERMKVLAKEFRD